MTKCRLSLAQDASLLEGCTNWVGVNQNSKLMPLLREFDYGIGIVHAQGVRFYLSDDLAEAELEPCWELATPIPTRLMGQMVLDAFDSDVTPSFLQRLGFKLR
jgi:hypothetical protein